MTTRLLAACLGLFLTGSVVSAADSPAADLAGKLSAARSEPATYVRLRMDIKGAGGAKQVLQVQIKERHGRNSTDLVYQVLFPRERKGEAVLLKKTGGSVTGTAIDATGRPHAIELKDSLLGSDLSCEDVIDDFFAWDRQAIVGNETINRTACTILESKPGKGDRSSYASVKTWVDSERTVPLRIEKYGSSGQLLRRIVTTDVVKDAGRHIPAKLVVEGKGGSATELDGSKIKHDVTYSDQDFTPEALKEVTAPR